MAYEGPHPIPVKNGGTGDTTVTGVLIGSGTSPFTGNPITLRRTLVGGASNSITSIATGNVTNVFVSNGASADPSYQPTGQFGNGMQFLSSQTVSAVTSLSWVSQLLTEYKNYYINYYNFLASLNSAELGIRYSFNLGVSYVSNGYLAGVTYNPRNSNTLTNDSSGSPRISPPQSNSGTAPKGAGFIWVQNVGANMYTNVSGRTAGSVAANWRMARFVGTYLTTQGVNGLQIISPSGGTISGTFVLYGVRDA